MSIGTSSFSSFADEPNLERCQAYVVHHLKARKGGALPEESVGGPAITLSYQLGAGARSVSNRLTTLMNDGGKGDEAPWTVFDRELIQAVLKEENLPPALAPDAKQDYRPYVQEVLEEILDLRLPSWYMNPRIEQMARRLADAGNVILLGHCTNIITRDMPAVFHARIVAPFDVRVDRLQESEGCSRQKAEDLVKADDLRRTRHAKRFYQKRADDSLLYHMVLNTDLMSFDDVADTIAKGALRCFDRAESALLHS